ncbi:unnamed protein product, partial [Mesorhabditis belari]|uniref:Diphthine--ammonia ligase n=1 Tax=Mesorhabditis belari TaxID=2138241 RepID=A0AAF3ET66_9BILA
MRIKRQNDYYKGFVGVKIVKMDVVGLVSGGKDSCYNLMCAVQQGHRIVALANLHPPEAVDELDSWMYQSVATSAVKLYSEAMGIPLYTHEITGRPLNTEFSYVETNLYQLLKRVTSAHPTIKGVCAGAILSEYQKGRVENVAARLALTPLAFLWKRDQHELLSEMITNAVEAILVKVAAAGLKPKHLGLTIKEMYDELERLNKEFGVHMCGEGGEYETFVLDCPLFRKRIVIDEREVIVSQEDRLAPMDSTPSYDFPRVVGSARIVQIAALIIQILCLYASASDIGGGTIIHIALIGFNLAHVARRWYNNIDGRYDLRQLISSNLNNTLRTQYAIALLTGVLLGLIEYFIAPSIPSSLFRLFFWLSLYVQLLGAIGVLGFEAFEVFRAKVAQQ